jgi:hypothetical protein
MKRNAFSPPVTGHNTFKNVTSMAVPSPLGSSPHGLAGAASEAPAPRVGATNAFAAGPFPANLFASDQSVKQSLVERASSAAPNPFATRGAAQPSASTWKPSRTPSPSKEETAIASQWIRKDDRNPTPGRKGLSGPSRVRSTAPTDPDIAGPQHQPGARNAFGNNAFGSSIFTNDPSLKETVHDVAAPGPGPVSTVVAAPTSARPRTLSRAQTRSEEDPTIASQWVARYVNSRGPNKEGSLGSSWARSPYPPTEGQDVPQGKAIFAKHRIMPPEGQEVGQQGPEQLMAVMQDAATDRKRREAARSQEDDAARAQERASRLNNVDSSIKAAVCSEAELRQTCAALEVGTLAAELHVTTVRVPYAFREQLHHERWQELVCAPAQLATWLCAGMRSMWMMLAHGKSASLYDQYCVNLCKRHCASQLGSPTVSTI